MPADREASAPAGELEWLRQGTERFVAHLDTLADADLAAPTALPGWSRAHLVAHVGHNARALGRLVHWARTGERTPMYAGASARDAEIAEGAERPAPELRAFVRESAGELWSALGGLSGDQWRAEIVTAQGRTVPAAQIVWMRCREVWVHTVDLGDGAMFADFPAGLVDRLLTDVTAAWTQREQEPALILAPQDRPRTWTVELAGRSAAVVTGTAAGLCAWITGRGTHGVRTADPGTPLPVPGRWL